MLAGAAVVVVVVALFVWRWQAVKPTSASAKSTLVSSVLPTGGPITENLRMIAGSANPYTDRSGKKWDPDRFYSGGNVIVRASERIFRTLDPDIYRHLRSGDFRYDIPLAPGKYELHLHFAETGLGDFISASPAVRVSVSFAFMPMEIEFWGDSMSWLTPPAPTSRTNASSGTSHLLKMVSCT